tara:strand:- start:171 stop:317 length:147 start_codon:yes stop_codon:yes gene_type:complete
MAMAIKGKECTGKGVSARPKIPKCVARPTSTLEECPKKTSRKIDFGTN